MLCSDGGDFGHHLWHETLATQARHHRHHQHHVDLVRVLENGFDGRGGVQCQPDPQPGVFDLIDDRLCDTSGFGGFDVKSKLSEGPAVGVGGVGFGDAVHLSLGFGHHHVAIEEDVGEMLAQVGDDGGAKGDGFGVEGRR